MNELKLSVEDVIDGIKRYYGKDYLFKVLNGAIWQTGYKSARLIVDGIDINIHESNSVIALNLWHSTTAHVATYIGHPDAVDIEINRLFDRLNNETNYVYERERQISSKTYNSR